jgi:peptidoglycan/xylan/chitin deacetylase (PgdA/CDA1 family)
LVFSHERRFPTVLFAWALVLVFLGHVVLRVPQPAVAGAGDLASFFAFTGLIRRGERGDRVRLLQEALQACGYDLTADGVFGPLTESAVKEFQSENGLYADGIAGPATLRELSRIYYRTNPPDKHVVKSGETLSTIAGRYGVSVEELVRINRLRNPDMVYAGEILSITAPKEPPAPPAQETPEPPELPPEPPIFPPPDRRVCLTFDDGPDLSTTRPILAILRQYGVKATFFLIGERVLRHPELAKEIAQDGHVIGVHGFEHKALAGLTAAHVRRDLEEAKNAIVRVTGVTPYLYRPPLGALDHTQVSEATKLGMRVTMWTNIGGADLGATSAEDVTARTVSAANDGGIIMLHEGLQHTVEALPSLIEALARLGYGFQNPSP